MRTRSLRLVLSAVGLAVLVSCSTTSEGSPQPAPTVDTEIETTDPAPPSTSSEEADLPYAGAPKVEHPLDTTQYLQDPCRLLSSAQAQELNVTSPGEVRDALLGRACEFRSKSDRTALVEVTFFEKYPHGLSSMYQSRDDGDWAFFDELAPIEGYPAVSWGADDLRSKGFCSVAVGVADNLAFDTNVQLSQANVGKKDPCETAAMVAGMALQTMKGEQ